MFRCAYTHHRAEDGLKKEERKELRNEMLLHLNMGADSLLDDDKCLLNSTWSDLWKLDGTEKRMVTGSQERPQDFYKRKERNTTETIRYYCVYGQHLLYFLFHFKCVFTLGYGFGHTEVYYIGHRYYM